MRKLIVLLSVFVITGSAIKAKSNKPEWKELKEFHAVMSKSFHPSEDGNLKPLKENAADLTTKAKAWAASKVPSGFDKEMTPKILKELVAKCVDLEKSVNAKSSDDELKAKIASAHETFHMIVEKCQKHEEGHENHEKHEH